jgi:hypothetical protein
MLLILPRQPIQKEMDWQDKKHKKCLAFCGNLCRKVFVLSILLSKNTMSSFSRQR